MKIIKRGEIPNQVRRFTCRYCGTIFEADNTEYRRADQLAYIHDGISAYCKCPVCGQIADA